MSRMARNGHGQQGHHSDHASYFTETSSVTNPPELLGLVDDEDYDDAISYISESSALTGWTTENSAAPAPRQQLSAKLGAITESVGEGDALSKSPYSSFGDEISAYNEGGESVETSLASSNYLPNKALAKAGKYLSPRNKVTSPRNNRQHHRQTFGSDESSIVSNASKKRAPVPQLRNPEMDDTEEDQMWEEECNCDINPTPLYQVIASQDWKQTIDLLDGKEEDSVWSLPGLNGIHQLVGGNKTDVAKMKAHQTKLRAQARTWIVRRERGSGVLKWRMLPIHFALSYQAPFEVVLRLYHLYPGSVRVRDHRGMLPLHICFFRGGEDRVLELFLDVFPDALDVKDDKGRIAIECTPQDGSDNERRSNIMMLFLKYMMEQQELMRLQEKVKIMHKPLVVTQDVATESAPTEGAATLGAAPRYTANDADDVEAAAEEKLNTLMLNAFKLKKPKTPKQQPNKLNIQTKVEPEDDDDVSDKYAMADAENNPKINGNRLGLSPIPEDLLDENIEVLKSELMALGKNNKKKGIRKIFSKKRISLN